MLHAFAATMLADRCVSATHVRAMVTRFECTRVFATSRLNPMSNARMACARDSMSMAPTGCPLPFHPAHARTSAMYAGAYDVSSNCSMMGCVNASASSTVIICTARIAATICGTAVRSISSMLVVSLRRQMRAICVASRFDLRRSSRP